MNYLLIVHKCVIEFQMINKFSMLIWRENGNPDILKLFRHVLGPRGYELIKLATPTELNHY